MEHKTATKGTILIVEDEGVISLDIRNLLLELGYKVAGVASSGKEALEMAEKKKPDLVLMDIVLKGPMDGIEAAAKIKLLHNIPSIFLTAYVDEKRVERAKFAQPFGYILKPFRNDELRAAIEMALFRLSTEKIMDEKDVERTRLEGILASSEEKFRLMFENAIDGILIADIQTLQFVMANSAICQLLGYSEKELLKMSLKDIHSHEQYQQETDRFMKLANGKIKIAESVPCIRKSGSIIYMDIAASRITLNNRDCLVGFFRDVTEKIKAENVIKESEERFRTLAEGSLDAIFKTDPHGVITYMSPSFEKMSGFRQGDVLGKRFDHFLEKSEKNRANKIFEKTTETGDHNRNLQFKISKKDGSFFWGDVSGHPIIENGHLIGTDGSIHDITERKEAEDEIVRLKEFNERIIQNSPTGIVTTDIDGKITSANPAVLRLLGSPSESKTKQFNVLSFEPMVKQGLSAPFKDCLLKGKSVQGYGIPYTSYWGKTSSVSLKVVPMYDNSHKQIGSIALIEDITERIKAGDELSLKNALLNAQKEASIEGILAIDSKGKMISHNRRFAEMWGTPKEILKTGDDRKMLKSVLSQLKRPKDFLALVQKLYANREARAQDLLEFIDGRVFSRYTAPLIDSSGHYLGRIWFFRDITHEIEIDRAKSEFISIASHELRTPLNGVKWLLEAILRRGHLTTQQAEFMRKALESNDRIINLANDLLDVTSLEAGVIRPTPTRTDLADFLPQLIEEAKPLAMQKQQTIQFVRPSHKMSALLDQKLVSQAVSNVLLNAIKYSGKKNIITVTLASKDGKYKIQVKDMGEGMGKAEQKHVFEQFFRGKAAVHRSIPGSGLGLYLAQKVLKLCGGSIDIKSEPRKGSTVTVWLPSSPPKTKVR